MPKVINQTSVSVDSLQAKLMLLENKIIKLNSDHKTILDSLKTVKETAMKAEISTSFYQSHLATYTALVSIIIALIAIIGWRSLVYFKLNPLDKKIKEIDEVTIKKLNDELRMEHKKHIKRLKQENKRVTIEANKANFWGLNAILTFYIEKKNYSLVFLYNLRIAHLASTNYKYVIHQDRLKKTFRSNLAILKKKKLDPIELERFNEDIEKIYDDLVNSKVKKISEFGRESRKLFYNNIAVTAVDIDPTDSPIENPTNIEVPSEAEASQD